MTYSPITDSDVKLMLEAINAKTIEELFNIVPEKFKLDFDKFNIPDTLSEQEVASKLNDIGKLNYSANNCNFLGGGAYDHYVPKIVDFLSSRSEFYTAYTPYQPEVSQGTLQFLYEYQTMICELSGMDIANASLYDGASAVAEACSMSIAYNRKKTILLSDTINPNYINVVKTYFSNNDVDIEFISNKNGLTDIDELNNNLNDDISCVVIQSPNFNGLLEDWTNISKLKERYPKICLIAVSDPISLSLIKSPAECGFDIYVSEGQCLGNYLLYGGPYIGIFSAKMKFARKMPGRIIGRTNDVDGKEGFVMTLQTREQHIRRERATSNICTNQGLLALRSTIYLSLLGKNGLPGVANICFENAQYAADQITAIENFELLYDNRNFLKEFIIKTTFSASKLISDSSKNGFNISILPYDTTDSLLLLAFTEKYNKYHIDSFVKYLKNYT